MARITVLGAGGWGMALANSFAYNNHNVTLWSAFESEVNGLKANRGNEKLLKGVKLHENIVIDGDINCASASDIVVIAVPSFAVRSVASMLKSVINEKTVVVNVAKGFETETLTLLSDVIAQELPYNPVVILSGPSHAEEVALGVPTSLVAACSDKAIAQYVQDELISPVLRVYIHDDVVGVEIGGALKNVIALCCGICDGMKLGDNTKAALMTRGLTEIARLGVKMGAKADTFAGLTGMGDLIVTCMSMHSRNRRFGILIGEGVPADEALKQIGMTVEGYHAAAVIARLCEKYDVEMPISNQCYTILYGATPPKEAIKNLMGRPKKYENESAWID